METATYRPTNENILDDINKLRLSNKGKWYTYVVIDNKNRLIEIKGFNTWLQIFKIDGIHHSLGLDLPVKTFKSEIMQALNY